MKFFRTLLRRRFFAHTSEPQVRAKQTGEINLFPPLHFVEPFWDPEGTLHQLAVLPATLSDDLWYALCDISSEEPIVLALCQGMGYACAFGETIRSAIEDIEETEMAAINMNPNSQPVISGAEFLRNIRHG